MTGNSENKEVRFDKYCETCEYGDYDERMDPCCECMEVGMREGTEVPEFWKKK